MYISIEYQEMKYKPFSVHPVVSKYLLSISWWGQLISPNLHLSSLQIPDPHPASDLFSFLNQQNFLSTIDILWQGKLFFCSPIQLIIQLSHLSCLLFYIPISKNIYKSLTFITCLKYNEVFHRKSITLKWTKSSSLIAFNISPVFPQFWRDTSSRLLFVGRSSSGWRPIQDFN